MSDYWSNFNSWDNNVKILPTDEETGTEHTFVTEGNSKYITHGKTVISTHGASWTYQDGDVTWYQTGNLGYKQIGVSNSVIEGWNFFTVLGMSMNTTVGMGIDSYFGLRVGINFLGTVDVNVAAGVRLGKGGYYDFEDTAHWETAAQKTASALKDAKYATEMTTVVTASITQISKDILAIHAGMSSEKATLKEITCATSCTLTAPTVTLDGPTSLTATTAGQMLLKARDWRVQAWTSAQISVQTVLKLG